MIAEIISIGTELLLGDITDTNSTYIAESLTAYGYDIHYISTVGDNKKRLIKTLIRALNRADIIITTGGLGPTEDDLTREAVAEATEHSLKKDPELVKNITDYFQHNSYKMTDNNIKQAYLPEAAQPIVNNWGTAPGILLKTENNIIFSLPGIPTEMKKMFEATVLPCLRELNNETIVSKTLHFMGIGESILETELIDLLQNQSNPTLALLAGHGEVKIRITAKGDNKNEIAKLLNDSEVKIRKRVGEYIYGVNGETLPEVVGKLFKETGLTISTAESCTGGLIGNRLTNIPGSSNYYLGGNIVYSNQAKIDLLGINPETLKKYGAVSEETAREMAKGVRDVFHTDLSISVTGIAGPGGGSKEKSVGLVYVGLSTPQTTSVYQLNLKGNRSWNKWLSSQHALYYLYKYLKKIDIK